MFLHCFDYDKENDKKRLFRIVNSDVVYSIIHDCDANKYRISFFDKTSLYCDEIKMSETLDLVRLRLDSRSNAIEANSIEVVKDAIEDFDVFKECNVEK